MRAAGTIEQRTIWGLTPMQLHDRFWASRGIQVVRQGEPSELVRGAELFLLVPRESMVSFDPAELLEILSWLRPLVLVIRVHDSADAGYRERIVSDSEGRFIRFERLYRGSGARLGRVALTPDRGIAKAWQSAGGPTWEALRRGVRRRQRATRSARGVVCDRQSPQEAARFVRELVRSWPAPEATVLRARRRPAGVWADPDAQVAGDDVMGPVWVGAGRTIGEGQTVIGPAVLWDEPTARPAVEALEWDEIEPQGVAGPAASGEEGPNPAATAGTRPLRWRVGKRLFDLAFAATALLLTLPLYPLVMLAIWLEDGGPFFFAHRRETLGGRQFFCLKFRSMRKDAEQVKAELARESLNQADGPQFFMEHDPRLTRVGRVLRRLNIDELPQFLNVLAGQMSVVGPRPSPFRENQYCPAWREARLSVRPGITGLWQVSRTRRAGLDFQEWIRFDMEYVRDAGWRLDVAIILRTLRAMMPGGHSR